MDKFNCSDQHYLKFPYWKYLNKGKKKSLRDKKAISRNLRLDGEEVHVNNRHAISRDVFHIELNEKVIINRLYAMKRVVGGKSSMDSNMFVTCVTVSDNSH